MSIAQETAENAARYRATLQLVCQMRKAQKVYFKSRRQADLIESKRLETAVDMKLAELGIKEI